MNASPKSMSMRFHIKKSRYNHYSGFCKLLLIKIYYLGGAVLMNFVYNVMTTVYDIRPAKMWKWFLLSKCKSFRRRHWSLLVIICGSFVVALWVELVSYKKTKRESMPKVISDVYRIYLLFDFVQYFWVSHVAIYTLVFHILKQPNKREKKKSFLTTTNKVWIRVLDN